MSINMSPASFGYVLISVGVLGGLGLAYSYKKYGAFKVSHLLFVPITIGLGIKFALGL